MARWRLVGHLGRDCWDSKRHVVRPFEVPKEWMRFRSMDWGSASPFSVGWWAIVQDDFETDGRVLPRGCMVRYREWYGMKPGQPNVGVKINADVIGLSIAAKEKGEKVSYGVLDPSAFAEDGGPSLAERISRGSGNKVFFRRADNTRVAKHGAMGGWDQLRSRLVGDREGRAMIVTFATCVDSIRTIPFLQHDPDRPEDILTESEDHAADEWRYGRATRRISTCLSTCRVWRSRCGRSTRRNSVSQTPAAHGTGLRAPNLPRALAVTSASTKNLRRPCDQQAASVIGPGRRSAS